MSTKKEIYFGMFGILVLLGIIIYYWVSYSQQMRAIENITPPVTTSPQNSTPTTPTTTPPGSNKIDLTQTEIQKHSTSSDCWLVIQNSVYAVTGFLSVHPGGAFRITPYCGTDATQAFLSQGGQGQHSSVAFADLRQLYLGPVGGETTTQAIMEINSQARRL